MPKLSINYILKFLIETFTKSAYYTLKETYVLYVIYINHSIYRQDNI